jgi:hypothetical protein
MGKISETSRLQSGRKSPQNAPPLEVGTIGSDAEAQLGTMGSLLLLSVSAVVLWPLSAVIRRLRKRNREPNPAWRRSVWVGWGVSALNSGENCDSRRPGVIILRSGLAIRSDVLRP